MNPYWIIKRPTVIAMLVGWLGITNILAVAAHITEWWVVQVLLFVCLVFLPGATFLRSIRVIFSSMVLGVLYSFGISILILMLGGLIANQLQPMLSVERPLEPAYMLVVWNAITFGLIAVGHVRNKQPVRLKRMSVKSFSQPVWMILGVSILLPFFAALGAFKLNNGGDASLAMLTLYIAGAVVIYAFLYRRRLPDGAIAWLIFCVGLAVLFMTSLRGWDIVGHDIQREFRVYTLTHEHAYWNIALDRDPYNACLSITILPEVLGQILHVSGWVVFKVILQIIFAACVAVVYILLRQYASKSGALVGSMLFICYPTFVNDSAMLTRQGVAYLFFALAIAAMLRRPLWWQHKILFLLCSLGAILSHYSTAYMFAALFAAAVACKYALRWGKRLSRKHRRYEAPTLLSPWYACLIFLMTFVWYTQITETSKGLFATIEQSLTNITSIFSDDNKSVDTSTALFFASGKTTASIYEAYMDQARFTTPGSANVEYYPSLLSDALPLTPMGETIRRLGIDPSIISSLRQNFARVLQVLALVGVGYLSYKLIKKRANGIPADIVFLCTSAIILLGLLTVLPIVSVNYGILRAFQQSLIFLVVPITLLLAALSRYLYAKLRGPVAAFGTTLLFFLFTGVFAQLLGGTSPSFTLNNQGLYFGLYYSSGADQKSFQWLKNHIPKKGDVRAANFNRAFMHDPQYPFSTPGILPSQINDTSFIYMDETQTKLQRFYTYYESNPLIMSFPQDYYDQSKNNIYSTLTTKVYR